MESIEGSNMETKTQATLTCPECKHEQTVDTATDACQFFYECVDCNTVLRPLDGDCCVFCSFADKLCPVKQQTATETSSDHNVSRHAAG